MVFFQRNIFLIGVLLLLSMRVIAKQQLNILAWEGYALVLPTVFRRRKRRIFPVAQHLEIQSR